MARDAAGGVGGKEKLMGRREDAQVRTEARRPLARKSRKRLVRPRVWALALLVCVVACASPATPTRDTPVAANEPPPRFAPGGPDAEAFGASLGYPKGNAVTFWRARYRVGAYSDLDEIFRGRHIRKARPFL